MYRAWKWNRSERSTGCWDLVLDATVRIQPRRHGAILRAERGVVLVTQAGDPEDHVLAAGQELRVPRGGLVVAQAFEPSRLLVRDAAGPAPAGRRSWRRRAAVA